MKVPPAPIVASTLSGFVVGVLVTLLAVGVNVGESKIAHPAPATLPPSTPMNDSQIYAGARRIILRQLGPAPNQKESRLISLDIAPAAPEILGPQLSRGDLSKYRSISISFRLNDHPLGRSWRLRAAKADIFAILKALYTSQLPIYDVELDGYFPLKNGKRIQNSIAVQAYMNHDVASNIPWKRWGRDFEGRLWATLPYTHVNPLFA